MCGNFGYLEVAIKNLKRITVNAPGAWNNLMIIKFKWNLFTETELRKCVTTMESKWFNSLFG